MHPLGWSSWGTYLTSQRTVEYFENRNVCRNRSCCHQAFAFPESYGSNNGRNWMFDFVRSLFKGEFLLMYCVCFLPSWWDNHCDPFSPTDSREQRRALNPFVTKDVYIRPGNTTPLMTMDVYIRPGMSWGQESPRKPE